MLAEEPAEREEEEEEVPFHVLGPRRRHPKHRRRSLRRRRRTRGRGDRTRTRGRTVLHRYGSGHACRLRGHVNVFATRAARRKQSPAPKRADARADARGGRSMYRKSDGRGRRADAEAARQEETGSEAAQTRAQEDCAAGGNAGGGHAERHRRRSPPGASARCGGGAATNPPRPPTRRRRRRRRRRRARVGSRACARGWAPRPRGFRAARRARLFPRCRTSPWRHELFDRHALGRDIECEALRVAGHGMIRMRAWEPAEKCLNACLGWRAWDWKMIPLPPGRGHGGAAARHPDARGPLGSPRSLTSRSSGSRTPCRWRAKPGTSPPRRPCVRACRRRRQDGRRAAAAQAAEMALGLRRAKLEEAGRTLAAAEEAPRRSQSQSHSHRRRRVSGRKTPRTRRPNRVPRRRRRARDRRPTRDRAPITRRITAAPARRRQARAAEARRAEVAALNVGAALLKVPATSGLVSGAVEASVPLEDALWGPTSLQDRGRRRRPRTLPRLRRRGRAVRGAASCAGTRRDRRTSRCRSGFCWSSPTRTTTAWAGRARPRARARVAPRSRQGAHREPARVPQHLHAVFGDHGRHRERG